MIKFILILGFTILVNQVFSQTCDSLDLSLIKKYDSYSARKFRKEFKMDHNIFVFFEIAQYLRIKEDTSCNQWYRKVVSELRHSFQHEGHHSKSIKLKLYYIGGFSYYYLGRYKEANRFFYSYLTKYKNPCVEYFKLQTDSILGILPKEKTVDVFINEENLAEYRLQFWNDLPAPKIWVNDYEELFTDEEIDSLNKIINNFEKSTGVEIAVITLDTNLVSVEQFDELILHFANTWGVGKKDLNNGITIGISKGYRKMRIQNGAGIENVLSDAKTKELIDNYFIPKYREGLYYQGTLEGISGIIAYLRTKLK